MENKQIIDLFFERNENAIKETEVKYGKLCMSIAMNILGNSEDASECVNDTYLGVWNAIPPERPNNLKAFVSKIARNYALKKLAYNGAVKRSPEMTLSFFELEEILPDESARQDVDDGELGRILSEFLRKEKEDQRNVFIRKYYFFDSISDIAKRYSFSESKVKSMLFQTRGRLKSYLKKKGVYL